MFILIISMISSFTFADNSSYEKGRGLVVNACLGCHKQSSTIAPSFQEISRIYKKNTNDKTHFALLVRKFLLEPKVDNILMKDALKKFGTMPVLSLSNTDIEYLSTYISQSKFNDLELPITDKDLTPFEKSKQIANSVKTELGQNLMLAIKERKTIGAIDFCHEKAIPLTMQEIQKSGARIKRATDRPRNAQNIADEEELNYILKFKDEIAKGQIPTAVLVETVSDYHYFSPIITNEMCLQCHGDQEKNIQTEVLSKIKKHYPLDQATGYKTNELRGIFSIKLNK